MKIYWIVLAFLSGAFLPLQAALNTRLGKAINSPVHASTVSFLVGVIALLFYLVLTKQPVQWAGFRSAPAYSYLGGILGAFYVTAIVFAFPRIGPALTFGLVVAGQMVISVLLDHYGVLMAQQHAINPWRLLGVGLVIVGVVLIRKF